MSSVSKLSKCCQNVVKMLSKDFVQILYYLSCTNKNDNFFVICNL